MNFPFAEFCRKFDVTPDVAGADERRLEVVWKFFVPISAQKLWPSIADTSSFNRYLGMAPRTESEVNGKRQVSTNLFGFAQEWTEEPWSWFYGQSIHSVRRYQKGIAKKVTSNFFFEPIEGGVNFYVNFSWTTQTRFWHYFLKLTSPLLMQKFAGALRKISSEAGKIKSGETTCLTLPNDPTANVDLNALDKHHETLKTKNLSVPAVEALISLIKTADDLNLHRIKAVQIANDLQIPKSDFIKVCLESVRQGLLTISWDIICPHCRGVRLKAESLSDIPESSDCLVCEVDFQTDSLESVEVVFHVQPHIRNVQEILFCAAEPAKKNHIRVQKTIQPNQKLSFYQDLREGRHRIRTTNPVSNFDFEVQILGETKSITWDLLSPGHKPSTGTRVDFQIENNSEQPRSITIEQLWWKDDVLHPADILLLRDYKDIFSRDTLEANIKISMGQQVIMFTDIVNSTQFYNQRGDAAAFNEVKKHFLEVSNIIKANDGHVIKTIGDSVMAYFKDAHKAFNAAVKIQEKFHDKRSDTEIRLRISLHQGQVIAVHLIQGIDLFGTTVNKAAKLQVCAGAGEIAGSATFFEALPTEKKMVYADHIQSRTSKVMFNESPLEGIVLNVHKFQETKTKAA